jgi:CBS domain-containing protein
LKTAAIAHRVADFLRRYPPFQYLTEEELLGMVAGGRVLFHEDEEVVFEQGQSRKPYIYVIQQGVVRLVEVNEGGESLRDVRGEGDLLGVGRYLGIGQHVYTARTETDVILYALPAQLFWDAVKRCARASRFLAAYFSSTIMPPELESRRGRSEELRLGRQPIDWMTRVVPTSTDLVTCDVSTPLRTVASRLAERGAPAAVIVDPAGAALGLVTPRMLSDQVASGQVAADAPAAELMTVAPTAAGGLQAGVYLTLMAELQAEHVLLTADGSNDSPLVGLLSRGDLTRIQGTAPLSIVDDIARARNIGQLAQLRARAEAVIASGLTGPEAVRWLAPIAGAFDAAVLRRVVALVEGALAAEGHDNPELGHCWVFFGSAGRGELLTLYDLDHGLVYEDPGPERSRMARGYFLELGRRVSAGLAACGFVTTAKGIVAGHPSACRSVAEWERAFSRWISDPIESCVYRATSFFDLRPIHGDCRLVERLARHIHGEEDRNPSFVPLLVNDSMANLPPLTFFRGLVIDDGGGYTETLDLQRATLQPIVDIARALALDCGVRQGATTLDRLRALAPENDEIAVLIDETAAAFRNALYLRARTGLTTGTDGGQVDPAKLTRLEQTLLKSGFRSVLRLMEYMGRRYGLVPRR